MAKQTFTTGQVLTAAQVNSLQANDFNQTVSAKTASYVLVASDKGTRIEFNTSGSVTCTVNTGLFDAGDTVYIQNRGAGVVTITAGTATVNTSASLAVNQWEGGLLYFISASAAIWYEYASTANGDITGVTAGTGISGGGTSGDVTITNTMATAIDAKGDLVAGTADNTFARLAVGSNGETLVADSSTSQGLRWNPSQVAGRNATINGGFDFWQRGTSFSTGGNYTADRWLWALPGTGVGSVTQQTFTPGSAPVAGYEAQYFARVGVTTVGSSSYSQFNTRIEDVRTFAGQTVTISFWAKVNSGSVSGPYVRLNQVFGSGGSTQVTGSSNAYTPTGSWARYSATLTLPSISGKTIGTGSFLEIEFITPFSAVHTIDFWGVQLELGSVATTWSRAGGTLAGELAACQRYYWRTTANNLYSPFGQGNANTTTGAYILINHPVEMRTVASSVDYSTLAIGKFGNAVYAVSSVSLADRTKTLTLLSVGMANTGYGANDYCQLSANNSTSAYVALNAEL